MKKHCGAFRWNASIQGALLELTERYDTVMFNIQLQLQRHGYHTIFLYFVADYPVSHIHAKNPVFALFQKRLARVTDQIKNRIQTVVQCLNLLLIKKFINLVNMSSKLQKSQIKIHMRGSQKEN